MVKCWEWHVNFLLLSDKIGYAAYGATVFFFLAMQRITLVRQPSHHDKRPKFSLPPLSLSWKTCLQWSEVPKIHAKFWHKKDLWQKTSRPGNTWRIRTYARLWALMEMYPWVLRDLADVIQEHSWQLTKCCGNGGSSWRTQMSLLPSGKARQRTQWNTGQSASHQLLGRCQSNQSYKTFPNIQRTRRWLEIASMYLYRKKWHTTNLTTFWDDFLSTLNNDAWFSYDTSCSGTRLQKTLSRMKCEKDDFKET